MNGIVSRIDAAPGPIDVYVVDGKLVALGFDTQAEVLRARLQARFTAGFARIDRARPSEERRPRGASEANTRRYLTSEQRSGRGPQPARRRINPSEACCSELSLSAGETLQAARVRDYLGGDLQALDELEVDPLGTPFQLGVWRALRRIPPGKTLSYAELARSIGQPRAVRAVARANALNPISLVIPCHRVIGADGMLRGYAGGLDRKQWLLAHERQRH